MAGKITHFYRLLNQHLKQLDPPLTFYKLQFMCEISSGQFSQFKKGKQGGGRNPSDWELEKLAGVKELGLTLDTLKGWRALDELSPTALQEAYRQAQSDEPTAS